MTKRSASRGRGTGAGVCAVTERFLQHVKVLRRHDKASSDAIRATVAILKAQQEATLDGILVVDNAGAVLTYNRRFLDIWGIPDEIAHHGSDSKLLEFAFERVVDRESFIGGVRYLYEHPREVRANDIVRLKDGRVLSRASLPVILPGDRIHGRAWYFRDISNSVQARQLESALFRIANVTRSSRTLDELYRSLHSIVGELMDARNFYIALYDADQDTIWFPYFVDEHDPQPPEGLPLGRGLTGYVLRSGKALLVDPETFERLAASGEVEAVGAPSVDWIGAPLKSGEHVFGVLGVQSYDESIRYSETDLAVLDFVSAHVAGAIEQKRKEDALRESEHRYRQMFENNRAVKLLLNPQSGRIVDVNNAACEFYGYTREQLTRLYIWDINISPEAAIRHELENAAVKNRVYFRFQHRLASGEVREVEVHSGPIDVGGQRLLFSIVHDVTERVRAERALKESEENYRGIFNFAPVGIYQASADGRLLTANQTLAEILGYESADELVGLNLREHVYAEPLDRDRIVSRYEPEGIAPGVETVWKRKDGSLVWVQLNCHVKKTSNPDLRFEGFVYDVTERKRAEATLRAQAGAMEASMDGIAILDENGRFKYVNDAFVRLYGYAQPDELLGHDWTELYTTQEAIRFQAEILPHLRERGQWRGEASGRRRTGLTFPQELSLTVVGRRDLVCVVRDITERTHAEEQIKHLAYHDALTSLPNRMLFKDRLTVALMHAHRANEKVAVLFLDLDRFKVINDSLGHNIGDYLLQSVAARLQRCIRESDTVARLGGDEFTILLPVLRDAQDALKIAQKVLDSIRQPFVIAGRELYVTTSIGISIYPDDGYDAEALIKNADTAMYQAKELGRDNTQLFNAFINARAIERLALENGLRKAIANEEFVIHYQPIFDLRNGRIHGMEALIRWAHPELGLLLPGTFIPLAEASGLMIPIGNWVLREACRQACEWHDDGFRTLTLSVNLAVSQLQQPDLVDRVKEVLDETGFPARFLELEITEDGAMQNPETSIQTLQELKSIGVRVSLDDFGIGHSSLSYLKRFPIDTLKIDQSFVRDITIDPDTAAIVTGIIALGHKLRLNLIAEGVEQEGQRAFLTENQCDHMQGFLFERPLPPTRFEELLGEYNRAVRRTVRS